MKGAESLYGKGQNVEFAGTLLLSPKDKKRLAKLLKELDYRPAAYLRNLVRSDLIRHEAKKVRV